MPNKPNTAISPTHRQFPRSVGVQHGSLSTLYQMEIGDLVVAGSTRNFVQKMSAEGESLKFIGVADEEHTSTGASQNYFRILEAGHGDEFEFSLNTATVTFLGDRLKWSADKTLTKIAAASSGSNDNAIAVCTQYGSGTTARCQLLKPAVTEPSEQNITLLGNPA